MKPSVLVCPSCGAASETPASPEPRPCAYCKASLHPTRCAWCFTWSFAESADCPGCAAVAAPVPEAPLSCPGCRTRLDGRVLGGARLDGCARCGGVWADPVSFKRVCDGHEEQSAYLGEGSLLPKPGAHDPSAVPVAYRPCARCGEMMNRVNFAGASGVIVDVCKPHGSWFDADELRRIVSFIRGGGLDAARERELRRLELETRRLRQAAEPRASLPGETPQATLADALFAARSLRDLLFPR